MGLAFCLTPTPYFQKRVPPKEPCLLKPETPSTPTSQEPSSLATSSPSHTIPLQALLPYAIPLVLVLLVTLAVILLLSLQRLCNRSHWKDVHLYPGLTCADSNTHTLFLNSSPGSLEASEAGNSRKVSLLPLLGRG